MIDDSDRKRAVLKFCEGLFETTNLIGSDFDDVQIFEVSGRDFPQQSNGKGLHVSFSVSWHAIGKTGRTAHEALDELIQEDTDEDDQA